jgi:hypothetical protein
MYTIQDVITNYKENRFTRNTNTEWQNLKEMILRSENEVSAVRENAIEVNEFR